MGQLKQRLASFSVSALSGALSAWRRWVTWCASRGLSPVPASVGALTVFLDLVGAGDAATSLRGEGSLRSGKPARQKRGGGAAASAVRSGLAFLQDHLELQEWFVHHE